MAKKQGFLGKFFSDIATKGLSVPFMGSLAGRYQLATSALLRREYLKEYKNWVFACVTARSEEVGNINLKLIQNGEQVDDHELLTLLDKVNPQMTKHDLFLATQAFKDLDGNAFWFLARDKNGKGKILEIYPMRPDRVQIVTDEVNPLSVKGYVFTQADGQRIPLAPTDVIHFKGFNPLGGHPFPHRGMGVVEAAAWSIDTDNEARAWNLNFFRNSARPDGILTTAGDASLDASEYKRLEEEWNSKHSGSDNASRIAVLSGGMKWEPIERSQKDMDFVAQRTFSRDEILALFRTPKSIIGITDDVNRANADAAIYVFALRTIKPLMQQMVDTLNEFLVPEFGDNLKLDFENPVAEDRKSSLEEYQAGIAGGWMSPNEVREIEGLPRVEGADGLYMPFALTEIGTVPPPVKPVKAQKPEMKKDKPRAKKSVAEAMLDKHIENRKVKGTLPTATKLFKVKSLTPEAKSAYVELWKATIRVNSKPLERKVRAFFDAQEKEVLANARQALKGTADKVLFNKDKAVAASITLITPFLREYIKQSGSQAADLVGLEAFDPATESLTTFIEKRAAYFAESINGTTAESLLTSIRDGLDNSESLSQIEDRIAEVYQIAKGSRTAMIARTEASASSNQGAIGAYTQAGIEEIEWKVVDPEDEDCLENEGQIVKIGASFNSGDTEPPIHPNCQCTTLPVFRD